MPNTPSLTFIEDDQSSSAGDIPVGITAVEIEALRGPVNRPDILITSIRQYKALYGALSATNDDPLIAQRILDGGSQLRINNIRHYTDPSDPSTIDAVTSTANNTNGGVALTFTGTITTGNTYTMSATGFVSAAQAFLTSALNTLQLLVIKFALVNPGKLYYYGASLDPANSNVNTVFLTPVAGQTIVSPAVTGTGVSGTVKKWFGDFSRIISAVDTPLFIISPIAPGSAYNNLIVDILPASNGNLGYFNMTALLQTEESITTETYQNLKVDGPYTTSNQHFLDALNATSNIIQGTYVDLSAVTPGTNLVPILGGRTYSGGTNGSATDDADYIGDSSARTGLYAFDAIDDVVSIACPNKTSSAIHAAGFAYAVGRKDLCYFAHLSNSLTTAAGLVSTKDALLIDNSYGQFWAGGLKVLDPLTSTNREISELGDVLAVAATCAINFGMQYSFAGSNRGKVKNALGVVNNFGTPGSKSDLKLLANHQINMTIVKNKVCQLSGNFTAQINNSLLSFMNVRRSIIFIKKTLAPLIEQYIEDPNNFKTWKAMYLAVKPFLDKCTKNDTLFFYDWQGDQFGSDLDKLTVNTKADVLNGIYKVKLFIIPTPSMEQIEITITIVGSTISISEILG